MSDYDEIIQKAATEYSVDPDLITRVIGTESNFSSDATSSKGAGGLMQIMPPTAKDLGITDVYDPEQNIMGGTKYLSQQLKKYEGDEDLALAAYNAGPGTIDNYVRRAGGKDWNEISALMDNDNAYQETRDYVKKIQGGKQKEGGTEQESAPSFPKRQGIGTSAEFSAEALHLMSDPTFDTLSIPEKVFKFEELYNSGEWDGDTTKLLKDTATDYWSAAKPEELPALEQIIGRPPVTPAEKDPKKVTQDWQTGIINKLRTEGPNPAIFGNQLDDYLKKSSKDEEDAHYIRTASTLGKIIRYPIDVAQDIGKGFLAGTASIPAGVVRLGAPILGLNGKETADYIETLPGVLGEGDPDYHKDLPWVSQGAEIVGQIGSMLVPGAALERAGVGSLKIMGALTTGNTLQMANNTFKTVYDDTQDMGKAYKASIFALPAGLLGAAGDWATATGFLRPTLKGLSWWDKSAFLAESFARNGAIQGSTNISADAIQQVGETTQTGKEFDTQRSITQGVVGTLAGGTIGSLLEYSPGQKAFRAREAIREAQVTDAHKAAANFQTSLARETVVNIDPKDFDPDVAARLGIDVIPSPDGKTILQKKESLVLGEATANNPKDLYSILDQLHTPNELEVLQEEANYIKKKQMQNRATDSDNIRLQKLETILKDPLPPTHINNIRAVERRLHELNTEAQKTGEQFLAEQWDPNTQTWNNPETGRTAQFLKELIHPSAPYEGRAYLHDASDIANVTVYKEANLNQNHQDSIVAPFVKLKGELEATIANNKQAITEHDQSLNESTTQLNEVNKQNEALRPDLEVANRAETTRNNRIKTLDTNLERTNTKLSVVNEELTPFQKKIEDLQTKIKSDNKKGFEGRNATREAKIKQLQKESGKLAKSQKALNEKISLWQKEKDKISSEPLPQKPELINTQKIEEDLSRFITKKQEANDRIKEANKQLEKLNKSFEASQASHDKRINKFKALKADNILGQIKHGTVEGKGFKEVYIPEGMSKAEEEQVIAHEIAHAVQDRDVVAIDKEDEDAINDAIDKIQREYDAKVITLPEALDKLALPFQKRKLLEKVNEGEKVDLKNTLSPGKPNKAFREYVANQIAARILKHQGRDLGSFVIDKNLEPSLNSIDFPSFENIEGQVFKAATPDEFQNTEGMSGDSKIKIEKDRFNKTRARGAGGKFQKLEKVNIDFRAYGEDKETAFSKKVREQLPEMQANMYKSILHQPTIENARRWVGDSGLESSIALLANKTIPMDAASYSALAEATLERASLERANNPNNKKANDNFIKAEMLKSYANTTHAQAVELAKGDLDHKDFGSFIVNLRRTMKKIMGNKFKDFDEAMTAELKEIHQKYKDAPPEFKSALMSEALNTMTKQQKIDWLDWVQAAYRTNMISGLGTQAINAIGGLYMGPIFTAMKQLKNPTIGWDVIKAMWNAAPVAWADAKRALEGKQVALMFNGIGNPSPLLIHDTTNLATSAASFYNKFGKWVWRGLTAADAFNRRLASEGYLAEHTFKKLQKQYANSPKEYSAAVAKHMVGPERMKAFIDEARNVAEKTGEGNKLSEADIYVAAYDNMRKTDLDESLVHQASDWADVVSLRGDLSHFALKGLNALHDSLSNPENSGKYGSLAYSFINPFGRAMLALADFTYDHIPFTAFGKTAKLNRSLGRINSEVGAIFEAQGIKKSNDEIANLTAKEKYSIIGDAKKINLDYSSPNRDLLAENKLRLLEVQTQRAIAGNIVGGSLATGFFLSAIGGLIEISGDDEIVLDKTPENKNSSTGKPVTGRAQKEEAKQTGIPAFSIRFRGTGTGIKYQDLPGLNVILYGTYKAVKAYQNALVKGESMSVAGMYAASQFYLGAAGHLMKGTSLNRPYKEAFNAIFDPRTSPENVAGKLEGLVKTLGRTGVAGGVPASGFLRDMKRVYDDVPEDSVQNFWGSLFKGLPGSKAIFGSKPALDAFGREEHYTKLERFVPGGARILSQQKNPSDETAAMAMTKGIIVPDIDAKVQFKDGDFPNDRRQESFVASREDRLAKAYSKALTPDEWYQFVKATGPQIERVTRREALAGYSKEKAQQRLIDSVKAIRDASLRKYIRTGSF